MNKKMFTPVQIIKGKNYRNIFFLVLLFALTPLPPVMAHKVHVFAYESGGEIITEAKFNNGRPAKNSTIVVTNKADNSILLQGSTDNEGFFRFVIPILAKEKRMNLNITLDVGEGHKGSWLLSASDYLGGEIETNAPPIAPPSVTQSSTSQHDSKKGFDCPQLEKIIEEVVEKELAPIKRMLAEGSEKKLNLQDILGGLGYIFGLAGIAAYIQSKKSGGNK